MCFLKLGMVINYTKKTLQFLGAFFKSFTLYFNLNQIYDFTEVFVKISNFKMKMKKCFNLFKNWLFSNSTCFLTLAYGWWAGSTETEFAPWKTNNKGWIQVFPILIFMQGYAYMRQTAETYISSLLLYIFLFIQLESTS